MLTQSHRAEFKICCIFMSCVSVNFECKGEYRHWLLCVCIAYAHTCTMCVILYYDIYGC